MTIRQWDRREELRGELLDLIVEMMALGRTAEGQNTPEFRRLDQELTEKNAELASPSKAAFFFLVSPRYIGVTTESCSPFLPKTWLKTSGSSDAIIPKPPHFIKVAVSAEIIHELIF